MSQENIRSLFLRKYVKNLINNIKVEPLNLDVEKKKKVKEREIPQKIEERKKISKLDSEMIFSLAPSPKKRFAPITATHLTINPQKLLQKKQIVRKPLFQQKTTTKSMIIKPTEGYLDLGKLNLLVSDVGVESIECLGPNKGVLVKKSGRVQRTNVILTKEEIKKVIKDFSEKTKIPLTQGTFKAILGNLIITAILSDFVGTKFILQKKNPLSFQGNL